MEGPTRTHDHAQVNVLRLCHDPFVDHELDLLGQGFHGALTYLIRRQWRVTLVEQCRNLWVDVLCATVPGPDCALARLHNLAEVVRDVEAVRVCLVHGLGNVESYGRAHELQEGERGHGQAQGSERRVGGGEVGALIDGLGHLVHEAGEQAVDDERRSILHQHTRLLQLLAHRERRGHGGVVGLLGPHDLHQRHDSDRVEEVEADHPLGVGKAFGHRRDRERRGVRRQDARV